MIATLNQRNDAVPLKTREMMLRHYDIMQLIKNII